MDNDIDALKIKKYVEENYELTVNSVEKIKNSYKIVAANDEGYSLKIVKYELAHFYFIYSAMKHLQNNGFSDIPKFIADKSGREYGKLGNKYVYLTRWIPSRVSNYDNPIELSLVAAELGKLHKSSRGFVITKN